MPEPDPALDDEELEKKWDKIFTERSEVLKALEGARNANIIGHSLDAKVEFYLASDSPNCSLGELFRRDKREGADILIVSQGEFVTGKIPRYLSQSMAVAARQPDQRGATVITNHPDGPQVCTYDSELLNCYIVVTKAEADGQKCERCWKYDKDVKDPTMVCPRCSAVLGPGVLA
ncbi:MAG TPA: hypothetical protein DCZ05_08310 [Deltaproteobacteria bacterium]|nr:hypothetical protein [Deltaproteobacteria bacterium]